MPVDAIGSVSSGNEVLRDSALGLEDFLRIFLTQLTFQDPLEPVDNREFLAQLAQFSSLEVSNRVNQNLESLLGMTSVSQSVGLLAKNVQIGTETGQITGQITAVRFVAGAPVLTVVTADGAVFTDVSPSRITLVR